MKLLTAIAMVLLLVGGLNWGLIGLFNFDIVSTLFGLGTTLSKIVYILIGLSALVCLPKVKDALDI
ncbi:MAG: DUF378 domain-containing protein [Alphaproteobacteria bacterium]